MAGLMFTVAALIVLVGLYFGAVMTSMYAAMGLAVVLFSVVLALPFLALAWWFNTRALKRERLAEQSAAQQSAETED